MNSSNRRQTASATTHPGGMQTPGFGAAQQDPGALHRFYSPPSINENRNPFVAGANGGRPHRYNVNLDEFAYSGAQPHQPRHGSPPSSCSGAGRESVSCVDVDDQNQQKKAATRRSKADPAEVGGKIITAWVDVMLKNNLWHPGTYQRKQCITMWSCHVYPVAEVYLYQVFWEWREKLKVAEATGILLIPVY